MFWELSSGGGSMTVSKNRHPCRICLLIVETDMNKIIIMSTCEIAAIIKQ